MIANEHIRIDSNFFEKVKILDSLLANHIILGNLKSESYNLNDIIKEDQCAALGKVLRDNA